MGDGVDRVADSDRLRDKIARLGAEPPELVAGGWRVAGADAAERLASLLRDIDETVLERRLVVENGQGVQLVIEAANRRVLAVEPPDGDRLEGDGLGSAGAVLAAFCQSGTELALRPGPLQRMPGPQETGISVRRLMASLPQTEAEEPAPGTDQTPLAAALAGIAPHLTAWTLGAAGDAAAAQSGGIWPDAWANLAEAPAAALDGTGLDPTASRPQIVVLGQDGADTAALICAAGGGQVLAATCPTGNLAALLAAWHAALPG